MRLHRSLLGAAASRPKFLFTRHLGICINHDCSYLTDSQSGPGVQIVPFREFANNQPVTIDSEGANPWDQWLRA